MCGIVAYTGNKPASPILLDGLRGLEYRGYDSVGMYISRYGAFRTVGTVQNLADSLPNSLLGTTGIAHTRWATHGPPSQKNTHPHTDPTQKIWLVHNGMIENYQELRELLEKKGNIFTSDTDSEVLAHLIAKEYEIEKKLSDAVSSALVQVRGSYGIAVIATDEPETVVLASLGSPMAIGVKEGEYVMASDITPMRRHTSNVVYLKDGEYAIVNREGYSIYSTDHKKMTRKPKLLQKELEEFQTAPNHSHSMIKEILEIPTALENAARGRIVVHEGNTKLKGLENYAPELRNIDHIVIVGCGSSYYAGLIGKLLIEDYAGIRVDVEYGSEFCNRPILNAPSKTAFLAISQSGETADIISALKQAKRVGMLTIGIVNVVGSTIAKEIDTGVFNHAGPEIGITSTKAFVSQLEILTLIALFLGRLRGISQARGAELVLEIQRLPDKARSIISKRDKVKELAEKYLGYDDFLFMGREYNIATAYEGALKLKKVSYVHAEGFPGGEIKHGPIAMINEIFPTIAIMPSDSTYNAMYKDVEELKKLRGGILAIATEGNLDVRALADDVFYIPDTKHCLTPILANIPLQLFAYYTGILRGFNEEEVRDSVKIFGKNN